MINEAKAAAAVKQVAKKFKAIRHSLNERARRLWAAAEANSLGYGGTAWVARATGIAPSTIGKGKRDLKRMDKSDLVNVRRRGAGRHRLEDKQPGMLEMLLSLVADETRGDPESPLLWTLKSTYRLADELTERGFPCSSTKVGELLRALGFSLQATSKRFEGKKDHPDRDAQFRVINEDTKNFLARGLPVISSDTKKKEPIGNFPIGGREWRKKGEPLEVNAYTFSKEADGIAIPYGIYDVGDNSGFVNVGTDHDTPIFAAKSIELWWNTIGKKRYPKAKELLITCDCGGSNSARSTRWKLALQGVADRTGITFHVRHFPPGTSKWNKIEHQLFSQITLNWRGKPLLTYETVIKLIGSTTTKKGLHVVARLDQEKYETGGHVRKAALKGTGFIAEEFHGEWNYALRPRTPEEIDAWKQRRPRQRRVY